MAQKLNPDKAKAYLTRYTRNGWNKTEALNTINPNATYRSNNHHSTEFHNKVVSSDIGRSLIEEIKQKIPIGYQVERLNFLLNSKRGADVARGLEILLSITGDKAPDKHEIKTDNTTNLKMTREEMKERINRISHLLETQEVTKPSS